jgi:hypothetical protein
MADLGDIRLVDLVGEDTILGLLEQRHYRADRDVPRLTTIWAASSLGSPSLTCSRIYLAVRNEAGPKRASL